MVNHEGHYVYMLANTQLDPLLDMLANDFYQETEPQSHDQLIRSVERGRGSSRVGPKQHGRPRAGAVDTHLTREGLLEVVVVGGLWWLVDTPRSQELVQLAHQQIHLVLSCRLNRRVPAGAVE